jgi:PAS domain S-box-containing protein
MALDSAQPLATRDAEVPFGAGEVFYSRTDARGVIASGNEIFQRVSGYGWEQLSGAPHRIVRHPQMPRGVFHLLWQRIQAGRITGAYVRNRSRDGRHYWVFAVVSPIDGGYLSVRIKPTSRLLQSVASEYAALLAKEEGGLDPAASADLLVERIRALGHAGYDDFMAAALAGELLAPQRIAARHPSPKLRPVADTVAALRDMLAEEHRLLHAFGEVREIPMNLHILASRIEAFGGPVATLAENYRLMAAEIAQRLDAEVGKVDALGARMMEAAALALLRVGVSQVQAEVVDQTLSEPDRPGASDADAEVALLEALAHRYAAEADDSLADLCRFATRLSAWCDELKRLMLGLDSIRVLCRVEAGRLQLRGSSLESIIGQLDKFHTGIGKRLDRILELTLTATTQATAALARDA